MCLHARAREHVCGLVVVVVFAKCVRAGVVRGVLCWCVAVDLLCVSVSVCMCV